MKLPAAKAPGQGPLKKKIMPRVRKTVAVNHYSFCSVPCVPFGMHLAAKYVTGYEPSTVS